MTPAERVAKHRAARKAAGWVRFEITAPAALRADIEATADRLITEWRARQGTTGDDGPGGITP